MKTLNDSDFKGKKTLVRCDFNVALDEKGQINDDFRIQKTLPTIKYLIKNGAAVVLMSHLEKDDKLSSLQVVAKYLEPLIARPVKFLSDCVGSKVEKEVKLAKPGQVILLENLRFHKEEKQNNDEFAKRLAQMGESYVNEAFSCSHRAHASIVGVAKYLPSCAGLLFEEEVANLSKILKNPNHPFVVVIGGAKVGTKGGVIANISKVADHILVGSKIGEKILTQKQQLMGRPAEAWDPAIGAIDLTSPKIHLPIDGILALRDFAEGYSRTAAIGKMRSEEEIYDIGPETIKFFTEIIKEAKTIFFNGPVGYFEKPEFSAGTKAILDAISRAHNAYCAAGGGETLEAIHKYKLEKKFDFLSTGGGATLEYLAGRELPGIVALIEAAKKEDDAKAGKNIADGKNNNNNNK